jgi:hypothetical protein
MESLAPDAFSEMKGNEWIFTTRQVMVPGSRNSRMRGWERSQFLKDDKKETLFREVRAFTFKEICLVMLN